MPKAYWVVGYQSTSDPQKFAAYGKLAKPAGAAFGARMLARGDAARAYEHGLNGTDYNYRISKPREGHCGVGQPCLSGSTEGTRRRRRARPSDHRGIGIGDYTRRTYAASARVTFLPCQRPSRSDAQASSRV